MEAAAAECVWRVVGIRSSIRVRRRLHYQCVVCMYVFVCVCVCVCVFARAYLHECVYIGFRT